MKSFLLILSICCCIHYGSAQVKPAFKGDMEDLAPSGYPVNWFVSGSVQYHVSVDSLQKQEGRYSISINKIKEGSEFGSFTYVIPTPMVLEGKNIELRGYIKTEQVSTGYAGLWLRVDGSSGVLAFDNMNTRQVKGSLDWKEYSIKLNYDGENAEKIVLGGLLTGDGQAWFDDLRLFIDGVPVDRVKTAAKAPAKAALDTAFLTSSGIDSIVVSQELVNRLALLGQIWGFLKYHHTEVGAGNHNFDAELFRILPSVIKCKDNSCFSEIVENWLDQLGKPAACKDCKFPKPEQLAQKADYGDIFDTTVLSVSLVEKLNYILENRNRGKHYYVKMAEGVGNPRFINELPYEKLVMPDAGFRLLCLYRYWNMINYFFPYKHLIEENWQDQLRKFIPDFLNATTPTDYTLTTLALIASIHDTHANIWSPNQFLDKYRGIYMLPVQAKFVEEKLVVTGYYLQDSLLKEQLKPGDIIHKIDGVEVTQLIKKHLPLTAASNYNTQLRDMPRNYLMRSNNKTVDLGILYNDKI